ncbi:MAG: hypothetical protein ACI4WG_00200 [Erysipelotrichaceae bacterium]
MVKRVIFYFVCLSLIIGSLLYCYQIYQPKDNNNFSQVKIEGIKGEIFSLQQFNEYISLNVNTDLNVIFFKNDDINSQYLFKDIFSEIYANYKIDQIDNLIYVQLDDVDLSSDLAFLTTYGFSYVPSLLNLTYVNGNIVVNNSLVTNQNSLISYDSVENWLLINELITPLEE